MSHFVVMVIGDDIEKQLQPFHEFECTGIDDEYVVDVDLTEEMREAVAAGHTLEDALGDYMDPDKIVSDESELDRSGKHKYCYAIVKDGELVRAVRRTNPNKKWDWWLLGGRWTGYFKLKPGTQGTTGRPGILTPGAKIGTADSCRWGDVDVEGMMAEARREAEHLFAEWQAIFEQHGKPRSWKEVLEAYGADYEAARSEYGAQPAIRAMRASRHLAFHSPDDFGYDREAYVKSQARKAVIPFAILKDGVWHEKGRMGWFCSVGDPKSDWLEQAEAMLFGLSPDTAVSIVDCHI